LTEGKLVIRFRVNASLRANGAAFINWFAQAEEHFRMIFAIGAEVLFRARMSSAAACVMLGANTRRSPERLDLDQL
jgi:hypothetical protein